MEQARSKDKTCLMAKLKYENEKAREKPTCRHKKLQRSGASLRLHLHILSFLDWICNENEVGYNKPQEIMGILGNLLEKIGLYLTSRHMWSNGHSAIVN